MRTISNDVPTSMNTQAPIIGGNSGISGPIRPPLYVPTKRDSIRGSN